MSEVSYFPTYFVITTVGGGWSGKTYSFEYKNINGMYVDQQTNYLNLFLGDKAVEVKIPLSSRNYTILLSQYNKFLLGES